MDTRQYAGVTHARLRKAAQGAGPSAKWVQCRRLVLVSGRQMAACEPVSDNGGWTKADKFARHIAAANPAAVLAMLSRIDELEGQLAAASTTADTVAREAVTFMNQRDQLLAALGHIAANKPVMMHDSEQREVLVYSPEQNPAAIARAAIAAAKGNQP